MTEMEPRTRWSEVSGGPGAASAYQQRFDDLAAEGMDIHGEAAFIASLMAPPVRVLDAGCGTGRVATQLTALGYHCVGVDADAEMVDVAEKRDPATTWVRQDLSRLQLRSQAFEVAVLAGNVVPLLAPGTLLSAVTRVAAHLQPGGLLVSGFGLDDAHLPHGLPGDAARGLRPGVRRRRAVVPTSLRDVGQAAVGHRRRVRRVGAPPQRLRVSAVPSFQALSSCVPVLGLLLRALEGGRRRLLRVVGPHELGALALVVVALDLVGIDVEPVSHGGCPPTRRICGPL